MASDSLKKVIFRITTVPSTIEILLKNQLEFLKIEFDVTIVSGNEEHLKRIATERDLKYHFINFQREPKPIKDFIAFLKLLKLFIQERPNAVLVNTPKASLLSLIAGKITGINSRIYIVTGLRFETNRFLVRKLLILTEKICCYCATTIIGESNGVINKLRSFEITKKEIIKIHNGTLNGIDLKDWDPTKIKAHELEKLKNRLKLENTHIFLFVGRLVIDKGIEELLETFKWLTEISSKKVHLLLLGDFEKGMNSLSQESLDIIQTDKNITHLGFINDVKPYFMIADSIVLPSYREGFSNVSLQAGAMGKPIIITEVNGSEDLIIEGMNGNIIPVKSKKRLFLSMYQHVSINNNFDAEKIRQHVSKYFSQEEFLKHFCEKLKTLI